MRIEFAGKARMLELRPLDEGAVVLDGEDVTQHDKALFDPHSLWRIRRDGEGAMVMPTLLLPYREASVPEVTCEVDTGGADPAGPVPGASGAWHIALRWKADGSEGVDVLSFTPANTTAATFTRDGQSQGAELLLTVESDGVRPSTRVANGVAAALGRLRSAVSSQITDERALRRRRRLRRMVDGAEAFEAEGGTAGRELLEQLVAFADLDPDDSVMELECGVGNVASVLFHYLRYGSYTGLDSSVDLVAQCRERLTPRNPRFTFSRWSTEEPLPFKDESLDFILATSYTPELTRVLRDGGTLFLATTLEHASLDVLAQAPQLRVDRTGLGALAGVHTQPDIVVLRRQRSPAG
jgi:hypothetical protein